MTQDDTVLHHLQNVGTLSQMEAATRYNIWRLAACIHRLKAKGSVITRTMVKHKAGGRYAVYRLEGAQGSPQNVFHITQPKEPSKENKAVASLTLAQLRKELDNDAS